ncbi:MAG TPA: Gfo/Idh/MocA family oxidoreductase [Bryobacteraceae bacterium]|nr:Gfo/Idh/MocA family oxidoreductase [Bryobacteraceae bacterium]
MNNADSGVSRRHFLQGGGAAAAGTFTIVAPQLVRGTEANSKVSVGLIGCGGRGTYDSGIVQNEPRAHITALCDIFEDQREAAKRNLKLERPAEYVDFEKLLSSNVDAVIIATPPFEHPRMLAAAVDAKKHIYCEKPMGVDVEGAKKVIAAGRRCDPKKNISVGFQQRYGPVYLDAYKRVEEGEIGELIAARAYWIGGDPFTRKPYSDPKVEHIRNWFCYKDTSGDFIVEQDCHNFDVLHWFLGLPSRVTGYGGTKLRTSMEILDHLSLAFEFPNGIEVNFEANQMSPPGIGKVGEEFVGTKGMITTSRAKMVLTPGHKWNEAETTVTLNSPHDITVDAFKTFFDNVLSGRVENVAERSALSTMIAILGRTAIYTGKEAVWKDVIGV